MRQTQFNFYGGLLMVAAAILMFLSRSAPTATAITFLIIGVALLAFSRRAGTKR